MNFIDDTFQSKLIRRTAHRPTTTAESASISFVCINDEDGVLFGSDIDVGYSNRMTSAIQLEGFVSSARTRASRSAVAGATPARIWSSTAVKNGPASRS